MPRGMWQKTLCNENALFAYNLYFPNAVCLRFSWQRLDEHAYGRKMRGFVIGLLSVCCVIGVA